MVASPEQVVFSHTVEGLFVRALGGELAPNDFRLSFNESGVARWVSQGLVSAGLLFAGAKELSVELASFTERDAVYRITWK